MAARTGKRQPCGGRRGWALIAVMLGCGTHARAADPAPVEPGLWEVQTLALFDPDPQPGAKEWPGLPGKPRARTYRICLDAPRAQAPMNLPRLAPGAELISDEHSVLVHTASRDAMALESLYRRLSEHEFEGSQTLSPGGVGEGHSAGQVSEITLQYRSVFVQHDCNGMRPSAMSRFGEP